MAPIQLKIIRTAFGMADRVAPAVAGWAAFRLFCRTARPDRLSANEMRAVEKASAFMQESRHHRLKTRHGCVTAHEFRPPEGQEKRGTVLVVHGWRSRTEFMRAIIEGLRDSGFRVISLDLPGHGHSAGRRLDMARAVDAVQCSDQWFGPFAAVVGHSFGGAVAVNATYGSIVNIPPIRPERLVLISAPESMPKIFEEFGAMIHLGPRSQRSLEKGVERIAGRPLAEFLGRRQLAHVPIPTLVIHAEDDREVSAESAHNYAAAGSHVTLNWANGLGHRRILADPGVVSATAEFVADASMKAVVH